MTPHSNITNNATFNHYDPLTGLRDIIKLPTPIRPEATDEWFEVFSPWVNSVARKARLEHSQHTSGIAPFTIDHITRKMVIKIVTDCQTHPQKAEYIGSLELAVLEQVRHEVAALQGRNGITPSTTRAEITSGSALHTIRRELAIEKGRIPTRAEVIAEWNTRRADRSS